MSDEQYLPSIEADNSKDKLEKSASFNVGVQADAEANATEYKKEEELPGACYVSCCY